MDKNPIRINVSLAEGDNYRRFAQVTTDADIEVNVYESLVEPGVLVVDVLTTQENSRLKVAVNDGTVFTTVEEN